MAAQSPWACQSSRATTGPSSQGVLALFLQEKTMTPPEVELRRKLLAVGLGSVSDQLLATAAHSIRLRPRRSDADRLTPGVRLDAAAALASGERHSAALVPDGTVVCWGNNAKGQLGYPSIDESPTPVGVDGLVGVTAIAVGSYHNLALLRDGTVLAWGHNGRGQLGDGTTTDARSPVRVNGLPLEVVAIAAGSSHSLALFDDGSVMAWGQNSYGQLGDGTPVDRAFPVRVGDMSGGIIHVAAGSNHNLGLRSDGAVMAWGWNQMGQLGDGTTDSRLSPVAVRSLDHGVAAVAASGHSLALTVDGSVFGWGWNDRGQVGDGTTINRRTPTPVRRLADDAIAIEAGGSHCSFALRSDRSLVAWGGNQYGQLGDGTTEDRASPVPVLYGTGTVQAVVASPYETLALMDDASVLGWGVPPFKLIRQERAELPLGTTKLGGQPDLPAEVGWPKWRGQPQAFIAQVNLGDVSPFDPDQLLPQAGLLSFFYDSDDGVDGLRSEDRGGWRVVFVPSGSNLSRRPFPSSLPKRRRFDAVALYPQTEITYAPTESLVVQRLGLSANQAVSYREALQDDDDVSHRMLGHPDVIQTDMQVACELVSSGLSLSDFESFRGSLGELHERASRWRLLLQVDSDDDAGMTWGDAGRLYYWIRDQDLQAQRFDQTSLMLESH